MSGGFHSCRDRRGALTLDADVAIVGSGAGGAVVATELALAGQRVVVLEEGPRVTADEYSRFRPSESLRHIWRDGGMTLALGLGDTPSINVTMGRVVGGSSVLTGAVCFRIPDAVLETWARERGLGEYTPAKMEPYFEHVEKAIHVETVPADMRSRSTELFDQGLARTAGQRLAPLRRNTHDCRGHGRCNFGCPAKAKMSVDLSYLPRAIAAGAEVFSHCLVTRVDTRGGRAVGVSGRLLNAPGGKPGDRLRVRARRVVVACGGWHTPRLLAASGVGRRHGQVGKNLTLHPGFRMLARFDEDVSGWKGSLQSAFTDAFDDELLTLVSVFVPVGVIAATMPGVGPTHARNAAAMPHLAMFGGMIHDEAGGVVRRGPGREPLVTYRMAKRDRAQVPVILRRLAEAFLAAGAREVFPPVLGLQGGLDADAFRRLPLERLHGRRFECTSQHPLGSARMSADPRHGVVDADGRAWDLEELYVVDGSAVPSSLGVNPQEAIMSIATRQAWRMAERPLPS